MDLIIEFPDHGVTDQRVERNRVAGRVGHPDDQIALLAINRGYGNGGGTLNRGGQDVGRLDTRGVEDERPVDRRVELKVGLRAEPFIISFFDSLADPVGLERDGCHVRAGAALGANHAELELGPWLNSLVCGGNGPSLEPVEHQDAPRLLRVVQ